MKYYQLFLIACLLIAGCQNKVHFVTGDTGKDAPPVSIITGPASPLQCPTGGTVVNIGSTTTVICNGQNGSNGNNGAPGSDGSSCSVQQIVTGAIISCSNGTSAYIANGLEGPRGEVGSPGADAPPSASVTIIPLCNATTTYPTVFSEVALCLNNKLYAVYSENNGFLSLIPPGNYVSNGHGNSCSLAVGPNCSVTH